MNINLPAPFEGLTTMMQRFCIAYVENGGKAERAARTAGYSDKGEAAHVRANALLRDPRVLAAIRHLCDTRLRAAIATATSQLEYLMVNGTSGDNVKLKAAEAVLDRGGMLLTRYAEVRHVVDRGSRAGTGTEVFRALEKIAPDMGIEIKIVDEAKHANWLRVSDQSHDPVAVDAEFTELDGAKDQERGPSPIPALIR